MRKSDDRKKRIILGFACLFVLMLVLIPVSLLTGTVELTVPDVLRILAGKEADETLRAVVLSIRMPRLVAAIVLGGALSVSGFLLQTFFANPIAGPFVLGISSGAKLTVALSMIFALSRGMEMTSFAMVVSAFAGAMCAMGFVLFVAGKVGRVGYLVVCGVMIGYICSAITDFVVTFADDSNIVNLHNWSLGSFAGIGWANVRMMTVIVLLVYVCCIFLIKPVGAYQMGEVYALNMGVNLCAFRAALILTASLLASTVTAFAGPISFVGVAVPHLMKRLFGTAKPIVILPACVLGGAVFCMASDLIARSVFRPTEVSISSVTAILGAPIVIRMMIVRQRERGAADG